MAFVAQDTRGHYGSEGVAEPFEHEARDGYDTCEWIVRQPWSDGTIAVFGESYVGYTALADRIERPSRDPRRGAARHLDGHRRRLAPPPGRAPAGVRRPVGPGGLVRSRQHRARPGLGNPSALCPGARRRPRSGAGRPRRVGSRRGPGDVCGAGLPTGRRSSMGCACRHTSRPDGGTSSGAASCATGRVTRGVATAGAASSSRRPTTQGTIGAMDRRRIPSPTSTALAARMPTVLGAEVAFLRRHLLGTDDSRTRHP